MWLYPHAPHAKRLASTCTSLSIATRGGWLARRRVGVVPLLDHSRILLRSLLHLAVSGRLDGETLGLGPAVLVLVHRLDSHPVGEVVDVRLGDEGNETLCLLLLGLHPKEFDVLGAQLDRELVASVRGREHVDRVHTNRVVGALDAHETSEGALATTPITTHPQPHRAHPPLGHGPTCLGAGQNMSLGQPMVRATGS